jgi:excisionase family DNA binding protein
MNETTNTTEWITLRQAGELHGVSRQTVLAWIKKGWIASGTRVGWQFVVDRAEIVAYVPRRGGYKNIEHTGDAVTRSAQQAKAATSPEPTADGLPAVLGGEDATRTSPAHQF